MVRIAASEIMQARVDVEHDLSKLGGPPRSLLRARHESAVVVDGLEQRDFEGIPGIENPIGARAETAWPIDADMGKRRHEVAGARTGHAPARRLPGGTRSKLPMLSISRGLVFCSAETRSGQSAGSAMSSNKSIGGWILRMIRAALRHLTSATGTVAISITSRLARCRDSVEPA